MIPLTMSDQRFAHQTVQKGHAGEGDEAQAKELLVAGGADKHDQHADRDVANAKHAHQGEGQGAVRGVGGHGEFDGFHHAARVEEDVDAEEPWQERDGSGAMREVRVRHDGELICVKHKSRWEVRMKGVRRVRLKAFPASPVASLNNIGAVSKRAGAETELNHI